VVPILVPILIVPGAMRNSNDFADLHELEDRILAFQAHYETIAEPFEWKFTRADLHRLLDKLATNERADTA